MRKALAIPFLIVALTIVAFATTNTYRVPTVEIPFVEDRPGDVAVVEYVVDGLKCRGTSVAFGRMIGQVPGVVSLTTYARTRTAVVEYDPTSVTPDDIRAAFEAPVVNGGREFQFFRTISQRP